MKDSLQAGIEGQREFEIDEERTIAFMGDELRELDVCDAAALESVRDVVIGVALFLFVQPRMLEKQLRKGLKGLAFRHPPKDHAPDPPTLKLLREGLKELEGGLGRLDPVLIHVEVTRIVEDLDGLLDLE